MATNGKPVVCRQSKTVIDLNRPFYAFTHGDLAGFGPLSAKVVEAIPEKFRRPSPCQSGENGLDIHLAIPVENEKGFGLRQIQFSLAPVHVAKFLPRISIRK
jgi:hypothetical protein